MGQGGVFLYGRATSPVPGGGNNSKPEGCVVAHNVVQDIGRVLVHVAGVALRSVGEPQAVWDRYLVRE